MRTQCILVTCLGLLALSSCSDRLEKAADDQIKNVDQVKNAAAEYGGKALEKVRIPSAEIGDKIKALVPAVEQKDLERLKAACSEVDSLAGVNVMTCYYQAFAIEAKSGPKAAQQYLAERLADSAIADDQKRPIKALDAYFQAKGTISTKDAALVVLAVVLETKFPHRGAILVVPFMDNPNGPGATEPPPSKQTGTEPGQAEGVGSLFSVSAATVTENAECFEAETEKDSRPRDAAYLAFLAVWRVVEKK